MQLGKIGLVCSFLFGAAFLVVPTSAETLEELDAMAEVATDEEGGILFAQQQAQRGEFLEAIATLERVLALHPKSQAARLIHAIYLCQIDDKPGGTAELDKLKRKNFSDEIWSQAMMICASTGGQ